MRQVVLDTETTGLEPAAGHRIIEIGCVEVVNRRRTSNWFHRYVNPERAVEAGALQVHGIDDEFLANQPRFADIAQEFLDFVRGAELVIHNADFDVGFIDQELKRLGSTPQGIRDCCQVLDTLALARRMHPGQRNTLDALAKRYHVDNSKRELHGHGALLDAQILAEIYLTMSGGQVSLSLDGEQSLAATVTLAPQRLERDGLDLVIAPASAEELRAHEAMLAAIEKRARRTAIWRELDAEAAAPAASAAA